MSTFRIEREMELRRPIDEVFAFFSEPNNLEAITPPWLRFKVLSCSDDPLRVGSLIRYRLRVRGIPFGWTSLISSWEPPHVFVDEQLSGPYRRWVHTHSFEERDGETIIRDSVEYGVIGGKLIDRLFVRRDLEAVFDYRKERLAEILGSLDHEPGHAVGRS